jgi:hypothetical protein
MLPNGQKVPAVIKSDSSTSVNDLLDWVVGTLLPWLGLKVAAALFAVGTDLISSVASEVSGTITGMVGSFLAKVPASIPFPNTRLPSSLSPKDFPFPVLRFFWDAFGVTDSALPPEAVSPGIVGNGAWLISSRRQGDVDLTVGQLGADGTFQGGGGFISGYQMDLAGGASQTYAFKLSNLAPDSDKFGWQVSGTDSDQGTINRGTLSQAGEVGDFEVEFPLSLKIAPGEYPFTLTVTGTETCATDPSIMPLSSSVSKEVVVQVIENPKVQP